jgi:hypothetical protein
MPERSEPVYIPTSITWQKMLVGFKTNSCGFIQISESQQIKPITIKGNVNQMTSIRLFHSFL